LYTPCVAAIATVRKELKSGWATLGVVILQCSIAWLIAFAAYRIGGLF
jgi:ferrous iron transport protein B